MGANQSSKSRHGGSRRASTCEKQQLGVPNRRPHLVNHQNQAIDFHQATYQASDSNHYPGAIFGSGFHKPLNSMFSSSNNNQHNSLTDDHHARLQHHSNTIHLARSNKSNHNLATLNYLPLNIGSKKDQRSFSGSLKRIKSTPLNAQQASYEAMRTIDMYLIRQIARSCMDFEMEQKIELEIRLRELAAQSMFEARNEIDVLEVEKSLLASDQRMNCYASLLELQRKKLSNPSLSTDSGRGSKNFGPRPRSDVIGASSGSNFHYNHTGGRQVGQPDTSSPSFSSLSNSQSPSKLSPVSGESAAGSQPSFTSSSHPSRTGAYRHSKFSSSATGNNTNNNTNNNLNNNTLKRRAKNKKRDQLMQSIASYSNINCNMVVENKATVTVGEIRIPLIWRDVDHFKGRGDYKRFAAFCLLRIDSQIYDTQLISDIDRQCTDITFDDVVVFNDIDHAFELTLDVYSCVYLEQFSLSSTPRKLKEKLTSSVSRAMGRRLATQTANTKYTKELQAYDKSYRFALIASATLRLEHASESVKTYDLVLATPSAHNRHSMTANTQDLNYSQENYYNLTNANSIGRNIPFGSHASNKEAQKNTLPLFGHFCCKLSVRPRVFDRNIKTGYLKVASISTQFLESRKSNSPDRRLASSNGKTDSPGSNTPSGGYESGESASNSQTKMGAALLASNRLATLSMTNSVLHWGLLRNFTLQLWPIDGLDCSAIMRGEPPQFGDPTNKHAPLVININRYTRLLRVSNSSLTIEADYRCYVLSTYCPEAGQVNPTNEISHWLKAIEQLIFDSHIWSSVLNHYPPYAKHSQYIAAEGPQISSRNTTINNHDPLSIVAHHNSYDYDHNYDTHRNHNNINLSYMPSINSHLGSVQYDYGRSNTSTSANFLQAYL